MSVLYTAEATAIGGRDGGVKSADGVLDLQLAIPKEMGGPGGAPRDGPGRGSAAESDFVSARIVPIASPSRTARPG